MSLYSSRMGLCDCTAVGRVIWEKLTLLVPTCSSLNMAWISVCLGVLAHLPPRWKWSLCDVLELGSCGISSLGTLMSHITITSQARQSVLLLLGVRADSWSWWFDVWLLKISSIDFCVLHWFLRLEKPSHAGSSRTVSQALCRPQNLWFQAYPKEKFEGKKVLVSEEETWKLMEPELGK